MPAAKRTMTESFVLLFSFWSLFPNSMARPDVRTHRSHRGVQQKLTEHRANNTLSRRKEDHLLKRSFVRRCRPLHDRNPCYQSWRPLPFLPAGAAWRSQDRGTWIGLARAAPEIEQAIVSALQATAWRVQVHRGLPAIRKPFELNELRMQRRHDVAASSVSPYS